MKRLEEDMYLSSPLLAHFYLSPTVANGIVGVEATCLCHIYESLLSQAEEPGQISVLLEADEEGPIQGIFVFEQPSADDIAFAVVGAPEEIRFSRRLPYANVALSCDIKLGEKDNHFELGPAVRVECRTLRTAFLDLRVWTERDGGDVVLEAEKYEAESGKLPNPPTVHGSGRLIVGWKNVSYPWSAYHAQIERSEVDPRLLGAFKRFARILAPFQGRGYGGLSRNKLVIDDRAVGRTPLGKALHQHLLGEGILRVESHLYKLDLDRLAALGVNWPKLMRRESTPELDDFLDRFLRNHPEL